MTPALDLLTDALAAYRLTKLASDDSITQGPRDAIVRWAYVRQGVLVIGEDRIPTVDVRGNVATLREMDAGPPGTWQDIATEDPDPPKLAELITCRWCVGVWVSAGVVAASMLAPRAWRPVARALALSSAAALLAGLEDG